LEYEQQILKNDKNWELVSFINTQTAYIWLVDYMNRTEEIVPCNFEEPPFEYRPMSQAFYIELCSRIKNMPEEYKIINPEGFFIEVICGFNDEQLEKFEKGKIWLEKNKGKYKLNKESW